MSVAAATGASVTALPGSGSAPGVSAAAADAGDRLVVVPAHAAVVPETVKAVQMATSSLVACDSGTSSSSAATMARAFSSASVSSSTDGGGGGEKRALVAPFSDDVFASHATRSLATAEEALLAAFKSMPVGTPADSAFAAALSPTAGRHGATVPAIIPPTLQPLRLGGVDLQALEAKATWLRTTAAAAGTQSCSATAQAMVDWAIERGALTRLDLGESGLGGPVLRHLDVAFASPAMQLGAGGATDRVTWRVRILDGGQDTGELRTSKSDAGASAPGPSFIVDVSKRTGDSFQSHAEFARLASFLAARGLLLPTATATRGVPRVGSGDAALLPPRRQAGVYVSDELQLL
jgi:hypothetical protein